MPGRSRTFILLLLLAVACARPQSPKAPAFLAGQIVTQELIDRLSTRTFIDSDKDGLADRFDEDIDGDGKPNLADEAPFDRTHWGTDQDADGIADFVDQSFVRPFSASKVSIQSRVFRATGITIVEGTEAFSEDEWNVFETVLLHPEFRRPSKHLLVIVRYSAEEQVNANRADFDPHWKQISFFPNPEYQQRPKAFMTGLLHELGHVRAAERPELLEAFRKRPEYVSVYARKNIDEAFAEHFVYQLSLRRIFALDPSRFLSGTLRSEVETK